MAGDIDLTPAVRTLCSYCGVGCGIEVHTRRDPQTGEATIARVSGDKAHPTNFGRLCTKGATHAEMMAARDTRMTTALVRPGRDAEPVETPVDEAVAEAAHRLRAIIAEHGPDAVALYVSGQMSLEAQYLSNKLAKGYLRTIHIESNSRLCMASAGTGYKQSLGADGPPGSYSDFDCTDLFFVIGSNMADCHPILFLRMADRLKAGAKLIVVDPRRTTTAERADLHLAITPGTDLALLNGLLHLLVESGCIDHDFIAEHTEGWEAMPEFLADYPPARVAEITGLAEADIRRAADMIAAAGDWISCWTMGLNQSTQGTWNTNAICNLHLATGAICRPGSGPMSLTGQPNAMGGREMGYMGPGLPGQRSVLSSEDREFVERQWDLAPGTIRSDVGPGTIAMFKQMAAGDIKACWIICTNPVVSVANRATVIEALQAAELVVTQEVYSDTATNRYADIVLPATLWAEADAVMVNSDRNLTLLSQSIPPPGAARPDWELICDIADHLGFGEAFSYKSSEEIFDEIRGFANPKTGYDLRGASYERLRQGPVQWPAPAELPDATNGRNPIRYLNDGVSQDLHIGPDGHRPRLAFPTPSRRAVFHPRPHMNAAELPDDDYPTILNTGRLQHQWHTMTKTGRVDKLNKLNDGPFVEIHPDDARAAGIVDRQPTEVSSRRGRAVLPAVITDRVRPGNCFVPFHWNDEHGDDLTINAITNDAVDPDSLQPEFKVCAVRLRPLAIDFAAPATSGHPVAIALGITDAAPILDDDEMTYLAGFLAGIPSGGPGVPVLPASAPVSRKARLWIDGVLAGAHSRVADDASPGGDDDGALVIWGSQTGNAEDIAAQLVARLGGSPRLVTMNDCTLDELAAASQALVVTSTFGDGGPPDNAGDFWERITAPDAPELSKLQYAVLGIGDRSYDNFCGYAKSVDARLAELGATRLTDCTVCEIHDGEPVATWTDRVTELVHEIDGTAPTPAPAKVTVTRAAGPFTRSEPIFAPLCRNVRLTPEWSEKEVRQFGFDISAYDVDYSVGDSLGVWAANSAFAVERWLSATGLSGDAAVTVDGSERSLRDALTWAYDISRVTPDLLAFLSEHCGDRAATKALGVQRGKLNEWLTNRNGLDLVREFPVRAEPAEWQTALVRLAPRQYSISTSPLVHPHEIGLTVSVVRYHGSDGSPRGGVASTFLADRPGESRIPVFLQRSPNFRPPQDPETPMIMVGPGTGIAPFRGFLQERRALGHTGRNWLFFGDRHRAENFYYREELEHMVSDGLLSYLDLAFSRDQERRIYVQHKMFDQAAEIWRWLADGAHFYVCGDAARMAKDVDEALVKIIRTHGSMSNQDAAEYKRAMIAEKRYVRDVY
ncbi:Nitrate reductase., NADPH--hemoprotein reductase [Mycolicibacterium rhodesiae JS60]|nr:Nitrate reductase., NADPH--hemoprotein reductase [Mycolicibacterium rhodesiae JS60]